ncbi:MAG: TetR/AcrR family transcriptional regulator [Candidatus Dormibacteraceae bacterium]
MALEAAILDAAWAELKEVGYERVTMENVAGRAGTSKAVLYRRWPSRAPLLLAAFRRVVTPVADALPDTGSLREDLVAMLRTIRDHFLALHEVSPDAVHGFFRDLDTLTGERELLAPTAVPRLLARAEARGEIAPGEVPMRVLRLPLDLNRHEVLITGAPPTDQAIDEIVDLIVLPVLESLAAPAP